MNYSEYPESLIASMREHLNTDLTVLLAQVWEQGWDTGQRDGDDPKTLNPHVPPRTPRCDYCGNPPHNGACQTSLDEEPCTSVAQSLYDGPDSCKRPAGHDGEHWNPAGRWGAE